ncbi:hypothetical protein C9974_12435 [Marinobacter sp. B9-2]|nr:hypothetical protein C9974_12435 [Marinobacter sp. B9-2]
MELLGDLIKNLASVLACELGKAESSGEFDPKAPPLPFVGEGPGERGVSSARPLHPPQNGQEAHHKPRDEP